MGAHGLGEAYGQIKGNSVLKACWANMPYASLVPSPYHAREEKVWGRTLVPILGSASSAIMRYQHRFVLDHMMVHKSKKTLQCPQTLSLLRVGAWEQD